MSAIQRARGSGQFRAVRIVGFGIASDRKLLSLIDRLPPEKRQPNLVLAASRYLGVVEAAFPEFRDWLLRHWDAVTEVVLARSTQTNEVGRVAVLLPVLAQLPGPLALIDVGASAGLCLYPDRFGYRYDDRAELHPHRGESGVLLRCTTSGAVPVPRWCHGWVRTRRPGLTVPLAVERGQSCGFRGADRLPAPPRDTPGKFVVAFDGIPLGYAGAHGQTLDRFGPSRIR